MTNGRFDPMERRSDDESTWPRSQIMRARAVDPPDEAAELDDGEIEDQADKPDHDETIAEIIEILYGAPWRKLAACKGINPDLFFPERGASVREAKSTCRGCMVREACLEYALARKEKFGIWGGLSERERRRIRLRRKDAA